MRDGQPIGNELTTEHGLEGLAKGLAQGTVSRRRALGALGGILGGGLLAALIPGMAKAQIISDPGPGNSFCAKCCNEAFPPGPERGECKRAGAQGTCPVDCDDCPDFCEEPCPDNGNNRRCCPYGEEKICVPQCEEGTVGILLDDGSQECVPPCPTGQERTLVADTVGGGWALRCEPPA
jgi:hypothetical protein